jgi:hypothetical protein
LSKKLLVVLCFVFWFWFLSFSFLLLVVLGSFGYRHNKTLGVDHVKTSEQCSAAIANGLEKQKDSGCPTIPCSVGSFKFEKHYVTLEQV